MITAELIRKCAYLDSITLEKILNKTYRNDRVLRNEFLGITNGNQFCYKISYPNPDAKNGMAVTKVFVWEDHNGELLADY